MTTQQPPPIYQQIVQEDAKVSLPWVLFFQQTYDGDAGTVWEPNFVNLSEVGSPTITGRYYRLTKYLTFFHVNITPATSTSSTAGTTYIDNYPVNFTNDGFCIAVSGGAGSSGGHITSSNNRIFTPEWVTVTIPLTIIGIGEAQ